MKKEWLVKTLVLGIILLLVYMNITPSYAVDNVKNSSKPIFNGNILYVGGSGEGNYTKIQDAVDNASDGNMVFVYDDSSPYYENIIINKSISLIGEDKNTTIIDGNRTGGTICIDELVFGVTINGFTVREGTFAGIYINATFCIIENNIISSNSCGVFLDGNYCRDNVVKNNNILNNTAGIKIEYGSNNDILYNHISNNLYCGVSIAFTSNYNNVSHNHILNSKFGIELISRVDGPIIRRVLPANNITSNDISFNTIGIGIYGLIENHIKKNNFIFNDENAYFMLNTKNIWIGNYWNRTRFLPYPIFGMTFFFPWINFDWYPAKKPYNILERG